MVLKLKKWGKQCVSVVYGATRWFCYCSATFRRPYVMLSTRRDVYGTEFRPIQQSYFLNRSTNCTHKRFDNSGIHHFYVVFMQSILQSSLRYNSHDSRRQYSSPFHGRLVATVPCPWDTLILTLIFTDANFRELTPSFYPRVTGLQFLTTEASLRPVMHIQVSSAECAIYACVIGEYNLNIDCTIWRTSPLLVFI